MSEILLAKGKSNGAFTLLEHTKQVIFVIELLSHQWKKDVKLAMKGAALHDLGKAHPEFQRKLRNDEYDFYEQRRQCPLRHEIASLFFLPSFPENEWEPLIEMIIGHHKSVETSDNNGKGIIDLVQRYGDDYVFETHSDGWEIWSKSASEILKEFGYKPIIQSKNEIRNIFKRIVEHCEKHLKPGWSEWRGLLMAADHIASSLGNSVYKAFEKSFVIPTHQRINELRSPLYPLSMIPANKNTKHTIVIAPTGSGKTNFLLSRCSERIIYTLPFQASINAMYERMKSLYPEFDIRLQHGSSIVTLNNNSVPYDEKIIQSYPGASIKILTPHQLAGIVFGVKGYEATMLELQGKDIILDEIHTYSDLMMAIILEMIKILKYLGCRIHIGTATMPTCLYNKIIELFGENEFCEYRLTDEQLETFNRHKVYKLHSPDDAFQILEDSLRKKLKILWVCNTVNNAQKIFRQLKESFSTYTEIEMLLIHSRFKRSHRKKLEDQLMTANKSSLAFLAICTQVVEVSLDISFDVMITECAPIDSLIQRFGRINRVRNDDTIGKFKPVYVLRPSSEKSPYKYEAIEKTYNVLPDGGEVLKEKDIQGLLDAVYPEIAIRENITTIFNGEEFTIRKLHDFPRSYLLQSLEIDSMSCITANDFSKYRAASTEEKISLEIPIPFSITKNKNFSYLEQVKTGSRPLVIPDELYDETLGLFLTESDNII